MITNLLKFWGNKKLGVKVLLPMSILSVIMLLIIVIVSFQTTSKKLNSYFQETINFKSKNIGLQLDQMKATATNALNWFESSARLATAITNNDNMAAVNLGKVAMKSFNLDFFIVTDLNGSVIARSHNPEKFGDNINSQSTISQALKGNKTAGVENDPELSICLKAASPVKDATGAIIGSLLLGYTFSNEQFVDKIKEILNIEFTVFYGNKRVMTTISDKSGSRITGTELGIPEIEEEVLKKGNIYIGESTIQGSRYKAAYIPLKSSNNEIIGMLFCGEKIDIIRMLSNSISLNISVSTLIVIALIMFIIAFILINFIITPIKKIVQATEIFSDGDLSFQISVNTKDEIGRLSLALNKMVGSIREMIGEIQDLSDAQVELSQQMNAGIQSISKSSNDQAANVEEVSSSMEEMVSNIQQNTDNARVTEKTTINAIQGVKLGTELSQKSANAMQDVAQKITIISEIAFQTNILALNAAVEAARAGEHGRGFAVVAAEVRKLAEKSRDAADDINKVSKEGVTVAENAGHQLMKVLPEIEKTGSLVKEIAAASIEQNAGSDQINSAVQQLNQIAQQNASASDELAASSGSLFEQAQSMKKLIGRFTL